MTTRFRRAAGSLSILMMILLLGSTAAAGAPGTFSGNFSEHDREGTNAGAISGTVTDAATGETLIGANVFIDGTSIGRATNAEGQYTITNAPAGPQTLVVTYIGYERQEREIVVPEDGELTMDFELEWKSVEGEEIVVTAQVAGQLAAINEQFRNVTIANVVSSDRIQELPDNNAAESIGRLPGISILRSGGEANRVAIRGLSPKFNTVTVNGVRLPSTDANERSVDLSLVSSNILDGIEVRKAVTPDMDADVVGGSVDLRLKNAPSDLTVDVLAQGGYTGLQDNFGNYKFVGTVSNRFLADRLGIIGTFNVDQYDRSADKLGVNWTDATLPGTDIESLRITSLNIREELVDRGRVGGSVLLDVRLPDGRAKGNIFYNELTNEGLYRFFNPTENNLVYNLEDRSNDTSILTSGLGVEQNLGFLSYDAQISYTSSSSESPDNYIWNFSGETSAFTTGTDNLFEISPDSAFTYVRSDSSTPLSNLWVDQRYLDEDQIGLELNVEKPFRLGDFLAGSVKTGGKLRWLDRTFDAERDGRQGLQYPGLWNSASFECLAEDLGPGWEDRLALADSLAYLPIAEVDTRTGREDEFLDGDFNLGYVPGQDEMLALTNALESACPDQFLPNSITSLGEDYEGDENYQAGYVMATLEFGRYVTVLPGIRYERDHTRYAGQRFREVVNAYRDAPPADLETLDIVRENEFWLPMIHVDIRPMSRVSLRLARTETISRPGFNQYAPITSINSFGSFIRAANSQLRPSTALNYDASVQFVSGDLGLVGFSAFWKEIDDLILQVQLPTNSIVGVPEGTNIPEHWLDNSPQLQTFINNEEPTTFSGFEIEWQTNFSYLPGMLRGLVLNLNYTRSFSETGYSSFRIQREFIPGSRPPRYNYTLLDTTRTGRMPDQSAHIANATLGWDYGGFSARLSYLYQSNTASYINPREELLDTFVGAYSRFDVSVRQKLRDGVEVFANLNNLNNRPDKVFTGQNTSASDYEFHERFPSYRELYGYTVDVGVRYRY